MAGTIVAPQPIAVEEGAKILKKGGNAVDAAIVCAMVQGVVDPHMCGIGGYLIANGSFSDNTETGRRNIVDAPAVAGARVSDEMWEDQVIRPNPDGWGFFLKGQVNDIGYQSMCVPGAVRGLDSLLRERGTISWSEALKPAIRIAREGFVVGTTLSDLWKARRKYPEEVSFLDRIQFNAESRRIYFHAEGRPYEPGEQIQNPDYARTLQRLADEGPDSFYEGLLAEEIISDVTAGGSFLTAQDLADYQLREVEPVVVPYRGYSVSTSPPPHGGLTLAAILRILEGYDLASYDHNSADYIYLFSMAMKAAFADRNQQHGDPQFISVPAKSLVDTERVSYWRSIIDSGSPIETGLADSDSPHTTHVCAADDKGNYLSLTHSLGMSSGVITPGLGFMYNNSMVNFHPYSGHANSIHPGKGRTTGMTPTIVYKDGCPEIVIGAPGATKIITAVAQVLVNVIDFGMTMEQAVFAPRFNCQGDRIECHARIPEYVCAEVRKRHPIERFPDSYGALALVHGIAVNPDTGKLEGAADPGADGMALSVC